MNFDRTPSVAVNEYQSQGTDGWSHASSGGDESMWWRRSSADIWIDAINGWADWLASAGRPGTTLRTRRQQIRHLAERHLDRSPWKITTDELAKYLASQQWRPDTLKGSRAAIKSFYDWACLTGKTKRNPASALPSIHVAPGLPRPCRVDVMNAALDAANDRNRLMLLLAARAGLRAGEISRVELDDIDRQTDLLMVRGKGGKVRPVPLVGDLRAELYAELDRRRDRDTGTGYRYTAGIDRWLFPGQTGRAMTPGAVSRIVSRVLGPATAHQLRHRFATDGYAGTRDLRAMQELLGHSRPETTVRYTAIPDGALIATVRAASGHQ